jgi:ketosteroid isomerase-like protein
MSQENVEAYKRAVEASNRLDIEALLEELDPEVEWHSAVAGMGGEVYRGVEGVRELFRDAAEVFTRVTFEVSDIRDLGDRVLALGRLRARGHESGVQTEVSFNQLVDFKDGKAVRVRTYLDHKEALEAAELRE